MLTEQFIATVGDTSSTSVQGGGGIFTHEFQPLKAQRTVLQKSRMRLPDASL